MYIHSFILSIRDRSPTWKCIVVGSRSMFCFSNHFVGLGLQGHTFQGHMSYQPTTSDI